MSWFDVRDTYLGFALPTLLIASVVMLIIMVSAVSAVGTTRTALNGQYYTQLAREAAESGIARANSCLQTSMYTATWGAAMLRPNTSCTGGSACVNTDACFVSNSPLMRSTFEVGAPVTQGTTQMISSKGTLELLRSAGGQVWKQYDYAANVVVGARIDFNTVIFGYEQISAKGGAFFATIASDGSLKVVGSNAYGQLSIGSTTSTLTPAPFLLPSGIKPTGVYTNFLSQGTNMFVIGNDGQVYGAGRNNGGQLGDGTTTDRSTAVKMQLPIGKTAQYIGVNGLSTFVLTSDGLLYAVGTCGSGQLGTTYTITGCSNSKTLSRVALPTYSSSDPNTQPTTDMAMDASTIFVRMQGGQVYAWGGNEYGEYGNGTTTSSATPVKVSTYGDAGKPKATKIAFDGHTLYVVDDSGAIKSMGRNTYGELGNGSTTDSLTPVTFTIPAASGNAIKVTTDQWFASVLTDKGEVWSAGLNEYGQLGNASTVSPQKTPVKFILPAGVTAKDMWTTSTGTNSLYSNTFVVGSDGRVYGAGRNSFGQLGDGTTTNRSTPVAMQVIDGVNIKASQVKAGFGTAVILTTDKRVYTVGNNSDGQLGDGTTTNSSTPVANRYTNILPITAY